jgi:hypothetical protein
MTKEQLHPANVRSAPDSGAGNGVRHVLLKVTSGGRATGGGRRRPDGGEGSSPLI